MTKTLTLWNGHGIGLAHSLSGAYVYLAAYSMADARRLCVEAGFWDPGETELKKYWNKGCWGISMDGITPERGIWVQYKDTDKPVRVV